MLDEQDRGAVLVADHAQERVEIGRFARVEAGGRLVEAEQNRIGAHGARDLEAALVAVRQVARRLVGAVGEADALDPGGGLRDRLGLRAAISGQAEDAREAEARSPHQRLVHGDQQVLQNGHLRKQADVLEGAGDPGEAVDVVAGQALQQVGLAALLA